ncbi:MAG: aminopeptidase [Anaerovoracaceae bacterium]
MKDINGWNNYDETQLKKVWDLSEGYKAFLDNGKTERECVKLIVREAEDKGYINIDDVIQGKKSLITGDKVYATCMGKAVALFNIGEEPIERGMNILGAHIDSPRIDVKQNPMYEDTEIAFLDTHYYGGIKKYQWVTMPLSIHGVVAKKDGTLVEIVVGEKEEDPVFFISDLLVHLSQEQLEKKARIVIEGEQLDVICGTMPLKDKEKDSVKANILNILKDTYEIEEDDFWSAELEIVPAGKAKDAGFDRSMVMAYGQDDRVCAYTSLVAMLEVDKVKKTSCTLLVDKEEIGSVGATGMESKFFENTVAELLNAMGQYSELKLRRVLANSRMLSSDVSAAFDPTFASAFDKKNAAHFGKGVVFNKFTGARGKSGSNDTNAEYLGLIRNIMDKHNVLFQSAELGKVDLGGGGTIAYILALYGMEVVDCGVAVLNMHAPYEVASKADIYEAKKCYVAFLKEA